MRVKDKARVKGKSVLVVDEPPNIAGNNGELYTEYKKLADAEPKVIFGGRLGEYQYYDMNQVIGAALERSKINLMRGV